MEWLTNPEIWIGFLMGVVSLGIGFWDCWFSCTYWPAMVFTTITLSQMEYKKSNPR